MRKRANPCRIFLCDVGTTTVSFMSRWTNNPKLQKINPQIGIKYNDQIYRSCYISNFQGPNPGIPSKDNLKSRTVDHDLPTRARVVDDIVCIVLKVASSNQYWYTDTSVAPHPNLHAPFVTITTSSKEIIRGREWPAWEWYYRSRA